MALFLAFTILLSTIAVILTAISVLVSFGIARQVRCERNPDLGTRSDTLLPVGLMLHEFTCLLVTLLLRPLGWLPPRVTPGDAGKPPVLLLHGLFQNRSCLLALQRFLQRAGYRTLSINTPPWESLEALTERVAAGIERLCNITAADRVYLVGHSLGGLLARSYLQHYGSGRVAGCVTIGSPHGGSQLAIFAVSHLGRSLLPGSQLLQRLNAAPLPEAVTLTAIYSSDDNIIVPAENARLEGAAPVEISGVGHTAMLFSGRIAATVLAALEQQETGSGIATRPVR